MRPSYCGSGPPTIGGSGGVKARAGTRQIGGRGRWGTKRWGGRPGSKQGTVVPADHMRERGGAIPASCGIPASLPNATPRARRAPCHVHEREVPSDAVEKRLLRRGLKPRWRGEPPRAFSRLALDSRTVGSGDLFCAIVGTRVDAHDFAAAAAAAGATGVVCERAVPEAGVPQLLVSDARRAASHLASLFEGDPGAALRLVGITGTNGKTTTTWLNRHLLSDLHSTAALGTLGVVHPSGRVAAGEMTTPDPLELMKRLAELCDEGVTRVAMEVSSHALDQARVDSLRFEAIVYTSFSREHLEYHRDMEHYRETKLHLRDLLRPGGLCVVNGDEPAWATLRGEGRRVCTYGFSPDADLRAEEAIYEADRSRWRLTTPEGDARVDLPIPGEFNVLNALAAACVALDAGLVPSRIAELLAATPPVPGRMEVLLRRPTLVLRDYAHTPDSYERVLADLRAGTRGRLLVLFGCGGDRDPGKRPLMGAIAARYADLTIVTTDNPRSEDPAKIAAQVVAGLDPARYEVVLDRREAIARALEVAGGDDVVLLLGKGHERYQVVGEEKVPFDEASIVRELAGGRA